MIIYNVTARLSPEIADAWLKWVNEEHIPEMIATGCFTKAVVLQLLEPVDPESITYAVQYYAESKAFYNRYVQKFAAEMQQKSIAKWHDKFIAFRTLMQVVN